MKCKVSSAQCKVWTVECWSVKCEVWTVEWGV